MRLLRTSCLLAVASLACAACSAPDQDESGPTGGVRSQSSAPATSPTVVTSQSNNARILPARLTTSVRAAHIGVGTDIAILFHPQPGRVTLTVNGQGTYKVCPSDALGLLPNASSSSSWSFAWKSGDCMSGIAGQSQDLPSPPDAHVGVVLSSSALDIVSADIEYSPSDDYSAYRLGGVPPRFTVELMRTHSDGQATLDVQDGCLASLTVNSTAGERNPEQVNPCNGGPLSPIGPERGIKLSVTGNAVVNSPLLGVTWP